MLAREKFEDPYMCRHKTTLQQDIRARQAEVEVKVERRPDFLHLSLGLSLNLPITLENCFSILLRYRSRDRQRGVA